VLYELDKAKALAAARIFTTQPRSVWLIALWREGEPEPANRMSLYGWLIGKTNQKRTSRLQKK